MIGLNIPVGMKEDIYENLINKFTKSLDSKITAMLTRRRKRGVRVHITNRNYVWCREKNGSENYHYHLCLFLNNDTFRSLGDISRNNPDHLSTLIKSAWNSALSLDEGVNGLVHFSKPKKIDSKNSTRSYDPIARYYLTNIESALYWLSYLAKEETKVYDDGYRNFGYSFR
jgi:hypothetical protein